MAPTKAAERQRKYRERLKADPERRERYLQSECERWRKNVEAGKKKAINELSKREQRKKRKMWRAAYHRSKERKDVLKNLSTPPQSPDQRDHPEQPSQPRPSRQRLVARKKYRTEKNKLKRQIAELQEKLEKERKSKEKYKKRCQRSKNFSDSPQSKITQLTSHCPVNPQIKKTLLFHESLIEDIRNKYKKATKGRERQLIAKVAAGRIIKKYRLQKFASDSLRFSNKNFRHHDSLHFERKDQQAFYLRDDVSRMTTGTKQTLTKDKLKMQKRFLMDTIENIHRRFLAENPDQMISYSLFCHLRPFWVVNPTLSERDTCMCKLHENLSFLAVKLRQLKLIETANIEELIEKVCCNSSSKSCMYGECVHCKDKTVRITSAYNSTATTSFTQWVTEEKKIDKKGEKATVKVTVKKSVEGTQEDLIELFQSFVKKFKMHHFNIKQQYAFCRELKNNMSGEEALIHVDFSENYSCKYSSQVQAVHFGASHQQATLHTGVLYVGGLSEPVCFSTISPSRHKGPPAIWQHLNPVLDYLQGQHPQVSVLHFLSDGPCTQYKQRGNFYLFTTELDRRRFKTGSWNFFEASHGKGAPDGVGGALKRAADMMVAKGDDIPDAEELLRALSKTNTSVKLFFVKREDVEEAMEKMPKQIPAVPGTMRIHQVVTVAPGELMVRDVSCMCTTRKQFNCKCFNTKCFTFGQTIETAVSQTGSGGNPEKEIQWESPELIGKWCILRYDDDLYPGIILNIQTTQVQVKCMHRVGSNRFFWPHQDDILWYLFDDVLELIPPPQAVTRRHVEVLKEVWNRLTR
ncbi:hypothetical protein ACER0C_003146 [Sarotherodon galilaeus]